MKRDARFPQRCQAITAIELPPFGTGGAQLGVAQLPHGPLPEGLVAAVLGVNRADERSHAGDFWEMYLGSSLANPLYPDRLAA